MTQTDRPLRVGIVGLGGIGQLHADNLLALGETLAGGVDVVEETRTAFQTEYDVPAFDELDAMLAAGVAHFRGTDVETVEEDTHRREKAYFFDAVRHGEPVEGNTVEQALQVQRVMDAIYRSDEKGAAVRLEA